MYGIFLAHIAVLATSSARVRPHLLHRNVNRRNEYTPEEHVVVKPAQSSISRGAAVNACPRAGGRDTGKNLPYCGIARHLRPERSSDDTSSRPRPVPMQSCCHQGPILNPKINLVQAQSCVTPVRWSVHTKPASSIDFTQRALCRNAS